MHARLSPKSPYTHRRISHIAYRSIRSVINQHRPKQLGNQSAKQTISTATKQHGSNSDNLHIPIYRQSSIHHTTLHNSIHSIHSILHIPYITSYHNIQHITLLTSSRHLPTYLPHLPHSITAQQAQHQARHTAHSTTAQHHNTHTYIHIRGYVGIWFVGYEFIWVFGCLVLWVSGGEIVQRSITY